MRTASLAKLCVGVAATTTALLLTSIAQAATVYCPNGPSGALSAPTNGRYVKVTNAQNPGTCYHQEGNLQNADFPAVAGVAGVAPANFLLLDKNGTEGIAQGSITPIPRPNGPTSGTWNLTSNLWTSYSSLYLGFHFGDGGGNPDSFVVQLQTNQLSGSWDFFALGTLPNGQQARVNGLSNYYLFGVAGGNPPPGRTPEPGSIALVGLALVAAGAARRRAANK